MTHHLFRTTAAVALVAVGALVLSGCGSDTSGSTPPTASPVAHQGTSGAVAPLESEAETGTVDPCTLLTQAEVDTSVGQPLQPGSRVLPQDCQWSTPDFAADVDLTVGQWDETKAAATATSHQPTAVPGVGDEALNLDGANGSFLYVRKGQTGFVVAINGPHVDGLADHGLAQEIDLAKAVAGRLS